MTVDPRFEPFHQIRPTNLEDALAILGPLASQRAPGRVRRGGEAEVADVGLASALEGRAGLVIDDVFDDRTVDRWLDGIDRMGPWAGTAFGPGRVIGGGWFTYYDLIPDPDRRRDAYRRAIAVCEPEMAETTPALGERCLALAGRLIGAEVVRRPGFAGPSVVVFDESASDGGDGDIHLDFQGLVCDDPAHLDDEAYSFVLMLEPAIRGGHLRVWGIAAEDGPPVSQPPPVELEYRRGSLAVFPARDLHQITEMHGPRRVTVNWHVRNRDGRWEAWF